ncbi:MAG: c-type cytochrome [Kingella sp. (in: b-proteobacteria)]
MTKTTKMMVMLVLSTALAACGAGQNGNGQISGGKGDISANRTTAFKSFMPTFSSMGKVVKGDEPYDVAKFQAAAASFTKEAREPFEYFQNDPQGNGDALPAIWTNTADFAQKQTDFLNAVDKINAAAQAGNLEDIKIAYGEAAASCKACHESYRRPK